MKPPQRMSHVFVEEIPNTMEQGVIYVSIECATAIHKCACGCGEEVVTPLSPTDWRLIFDGESVSLRPSVGNWSFPCRSHYFIDEGLIEWAGDMSNEDINLGRMIDRRNKAAYFNKATTVNTPPVGGGSTDQLQPHREDTSSTSKRSSLWAVLKRWWKS